MKVGLITTTINIPKVLELYRAYGPDVGFFVAGDEKTPKEASLGSDIPHFMPIDYQEVRWPELSRLVGRNTIARRNFALLAALEWGAEIIVTIDDDNIPLNVSYFDDFERVLTPASYLNKGIVPENIIFHKGHKGLQVRGTYGWFDVGQLLDPISPHRGFPLEASSTYEVGHVTDARIGVAAGICLGDPDISAVTRIARSPFVQRGSILLEGGVVVSSDTWTVFNSQNTAFIRELAPCFLMLPQIGRYDDIFASLIAQKVMKDLGYQVHFGKPFVFQQRNAHNLVSDLKKEVWGYENIWPIANALARPKIMEGSAIAAVQRCYQSVFDQLPEGVEPLLHAWLDECEKVL